jgi:DNA repair exonuclease SbcCD ATPase subunit
MNRSTLVLGFTVFCTVIGCDASPFRKYSVRTDEHFEKAKKDIHEAANSTAEALSSVRVDYANECQAKLNALDKQYAEIRDQGKNASGEAKAELYKRLQTLQERRDGIRERLEDYRKANDKAAENLRTGLEAALADYQNALLVK